MEFFVGTADRMEIKPLAAPGALDGVITSPSPAASVRHPIHVIDAAKFGAHVATPPPAVLRLLFNHPLTDKGPADSPAHWAKTGQHLA
jgi:hypothetical protein